MQFTRELVGKIKDGKKTETRRIVKSEEELIEPRGIPFPARVEIHTPYRMQSYGYSIRLKWQVGRDYAVCPGRGKKQVARIRITAIRRERVRDITEEDARDEGAEPYLTRLHPDGPCDYKSPFAYREGFRLLWDTINTKPGTRWEDDPEVWVLKFELIEETKDDNLLHQVA